MLRVVAGLAVAVSIDVFFFDGRYSAGAGQLVLSILRGFGLM